MRLKPVKVSGTLAFAQRCTGENWTCETTTAGVGYCWGHNMHGELGDTPSSIAACDADRAADVNEVSPRLWPHLRSRPSTGRPGNERWR